MSGAQHRIEDPYLHLISSRNLSKPQFQNILHMLSTMTRKLESLSVMLYLVLTDLSQLLTAFILSSYRDAKLPAAVITEARLS